MTVLLASGAALLALAFIAEFARRRHFLNPARMRRITSTGMYDSYRDLDN